MTTATANNFDRNLDALSITAVQGSVCSGECYYPRNPTVQAQLQAQRTRDFLASNYTYTRGLTQAESKSRMGDILRDFDRSFERVPRRSRKTRL